MRSDTMALVAGLAGSFRPPTICRILISIRAGLHDHSVSLAQQNPNLFGHGDPPLSVTSAGRIGPGGDDTCSSVG